MSKSAETSAFRPVSDASTTAAQAAYDALQPRRALQQARIVNGWDAIPGQFPFLAYMRGLQSCTRSIPSRASVSAGTKSAKPGRSLAEEARATTVCSGALITPRIMLTAGHCLFKCESTAAPDSLPDEETNTRTEYLSWGAPLQMKLNMIDISLPASGVDGADQKFASGAARHPDFKSIGGIPLENDIALVWFDNSSIITPAQISTKQGYSEGQKFTIAGWGYTEAGEYSITDILKTAEVPFVTKAKCEEVYDEPIFDKNICAGADPATFADTCTGDSGGPMVMNVSNPSVPYGKKVAGITSWGESCANEYPGVYTNVAKYANWIDETITLTNAGGDEPPKIGCSYHVGHRYTGSGGVKLTKISNAGQCCNACKVTGTTCRSWAFHTKTKTCMLYKNVTKRTLSETWTSGNVTGTIPTGQSSCELEYYVKYTDPAGTQTLATQPAETPQDCCSTCRNNSRCRHMTFNVNTKACTLFRGPSKTAGWGRKAWQYDYVSGLVSRR